MFTGPSKLKEERLPRQLHNPKEITTSFLRVLIQYHKSTIVSYSNQLEW